jgi:hypothetical protein
MRLCKYAVCGYAVMQVRFTDETRPSLYRRYVLGSNPETVLTYNRALDFEKHDVEFESGPITVNANKRMNRSNVGLNRQGF